MFILKACRVCIIRASCCEACPEVIKRYHQMFTIRKITIIIFAICYTITPQFIAMFFKYESLLIATLSISLLFISICLFLFYLIFIPRDIKKAAKKFPKDFE